MKTITSFAHRRILTSLAIILTMFLLMPTIGGAQEAGQGTITGTVTNGTTGEPGSSTEVTLSAFTRDGLIAEFSATTDDSGNFEFVQVDTAEGIVYAASVSYRGVLYGSGMIRFLDTTEQSTEILVYETTTNRSVVQVNSRGLVLSELDPESGTATMLDITSLAVTEDLTYVPGDTGRSVEFPLPRNAGTPSLMPGFDFGTAVVENSVLYASSPLRPDGGSATISYPVQYTDQTFSLDIQHVYPTETFRVLVPTDLSESADAITVNASGLVDEGVATIGEREYHVWTATDLQPDSVVRVRFGSLPASEFEPNRLRTLEPALLAGVALLAATVATVVMVRRNHFEPADPDVEHAVTAGFIESREELVVQLQELQDEYENGMIDEEMYLAERRQLLERLRAVSRHLRDTPEPEPETP